MRSFGKNARSIRKIRAPAIITDLALLHQLFQCIANSRSLIWIEIIEVKLVEVNVIGHETFQRLLTSSGNAFRVATCWLSSDRIWQPTKFSGNDRFVAFPF